MACDITCNNDELEEDAADVFEFHSDQERQQLVKHITSYMYNDVDAVFNVDDYILNEYNTPL